MILEGIVTTRNADKTPNVSPMGPRFDAENQWQQFVLRPFQTSTTFRNLKRHGFGVLHVTDDALLIAKAAIGQLNPLPRMLDAEAIDGVILADACRWCAFQVVELDDADERTTIKCEVVDQGRHRDFFGFNRAKHAVIEAAILATRVGILPDTEILDAFDRLRAPIEKTGAADEHLAFDLLDRYVKRALQESFSTK